MSLPLARSLLYASRAIGALHLPQAQKRVQEYVKAQPKDPKDARKHQCDDKLQKVRARDGGNVARLHPRGQTLCLMSFPWFQYLSPFLHSSLACRVCILSLSLSLSSSLA